MGTGSGGKCTQAVLLGFLGHSAGTTGVPLSVLRANSGGMADGHLKGLVAAVHGVEKSSSRLSNSNHHPEETTPGMRVFLLRSHSRAWGRSSISAPCHAASLARALLSAQPARPAALPPVSLPGSWAPPGLPLTAATPRPRGKINPADNSFLESSTLTTGETAGSTYKGLLMHLRLCIPEDKHFYSMQQKRLSKRGSEHGHEGGGQLNRLHCLGNYDDHSKSAGFDN